MNSLLIGNERLPRLPEIIQIVIIVSQLISPHLSQQGTIVRNPKSNLLCLSHPPSSRIGTDDVMMIVVNFPCGGRDGDSQEASMVQTRLFV